MFPSLNESIGWSRDLETILPNSTILLGDSGAIDTLPFILNFMNFWLKSPSEPFSSVIFVSFKNSQTRISSVFRKIFSLQLNLLTAQSRFFFIDAVSGNDNDYSSLIVKELKEALKKVTGGRVLVILEGFAWTINLESPKFFSALLRKINLLLNEEASKGFNLLIQWSRDLEEDYPGRNQLLIEDVRLGGLGWLSLLSSCHYVFCVRPLKSGMSRDASGEIVASLGPLMQKGKYIFHPLTCLYRIPSDTLIQSFSKGRI